MSLHQLPRHSAASHAMPLTSVEFVCASRGGLSSLAPQINAFIVDPICVKHWTIELACEHGFLRLLQRLVSDMNAAAHKKPQLYRSHVFSRALAHAVMHDNDIALLECLQTYCPDGFASLGMEAAARVGKLHVLQWLETHFEPHIIWSSRFAMAAASNGHVDVLQWLAIKFRPHPDRLCAILQAAVASGDLASVQYLFEQAQRDGVKPAQYQLRSIVEEACGAGQLEIVKYLLDDRGYKSIKSLNCIRQAVVSGNLELVQWLYTRGYRTLELFSIKLAIERNHVDVVQWWSEHYAHIRDEQTHTIAKLAEQAGYAISQLLYTKRPEVFDARFLEHKFTYIDMGSDLDVIKWHVSLLRALGWPSTVSLEEGYTAIWFAAENGYLDIVQFLFATLCEHCSERILIEKAAVSKAAGNGHVDVVQWLHANRTTDTRANYKIRLAAANGHLELIQWMVVNADRCSYDFDFLEAAAASGSLATLVWLYAYYRHESFNLRPSVIEAAVKHNHVPIVQWLHEQNAEGWTEELMDLATGFAMVEVTTQWINMATSVEMTAWLHFNRSAGCTTEAMDRAAERGDFDTLLFLHEHRSEGCTANAAALAQRNGHHLIVQWLFETFPSMITTESVYEHLGHVSANEVLFWPPQLKSNIDVSSYDVVKVRSLQCE